MKYEAEMASLQNCPPAASETAHQAAIFRFFHDPDCDKNYLPPAKLNPRRKWPSDEEACDGFGISLFFSEGKAEAYFRRLEQTNPNIGKNIGKHLARGSIIESDGRITPEDANGHFSLFESDTCNLKGQLTKFKTLTS